MKKKYKSTNQTNKILTYTAWFLAILAISLTSLVVGYYFGYDDIQNEKSEKVEFFKELQHTKPPISINHKLQEILKEEVKEDVTASHEYADTASHKPPAMVKRKNIRYTTKARLSIIIDDVSTKSQVNAIKNLHMPITMSFLPPSPNRPNSAKLASKENFYMVHLPMEALNFNKEEPFTLRAEDSKKVIDERITRLKELFPRVKYINNHTGSKFTSSEIAMNRLISVLNSKRIHFIDSRTTAKTKAPKVLKNFGLKYIARDVFLDNKDDKKYIMNQIKKAIQIAKAHGTAIAIGHPHLNTILALNASKKMLKDVELVYINRLNITP